MRLIGEAMYDGELRPARRLHWIEDVERDDQRLHASHAGERLRTEADVLVEEPEELAIAEPDSSRERGGVGLASIDGVDRGAQTAIGRVPSWPAEQRLVEQRDTRIHVDFVETLGQLATPMATDFAKTERSIADVAGRDREERRRLAGTKSDAEEIDLALCGDRLGDDRRRHHADDARVRSVFMTMTGEIEEEIDAAVGEDAMARFGARDAAE